MGSDRDRDKVDRVEAAIATGQLWRAKEILSGRLGSAEFKPDVYEQLGRVLLQMGDDPQAGKFLFLSGVRRPEYAGAIDLFVRRHSRGGWQSLVGSFPASARAASWANLPPQVRDDLRALGVPARPAVEGVRRTLEKYPRSQASGPGCTAVLVVAVAIGLLIALIVVFFYDH